MYVYIQMSYSVCISAPNAAPSNFRNISKTSTTITFQWDRLVLSQYDSRITWYVITCSDLEEITVITVSVYIANYDYYHIHSWLYSKTFKGKTHVEFSPTLKVF